MWKAKLINGDSFTLTDVEANALIAGMESRMPVNLGYAVINGVSVASLVNEVAAKDKMNPIINDPDFIDWLNGNDRKVEALNSRYYGDKYNDEWKHALEYKKKFDSGEIKLLQ